MSTLRPNRPLGFLRLPFGLNIPSAQILLWSLVAALTIFGVFILPLAFPTSTFTASSSYLIGFNNRVAAASVIFISMGTTAFLVRRNWGVRSLPGTQTDKLGLQWLAIASAAAVLFTAIFGGLIAHAQSDYRDVAYWQVQIGHWAHDHARLYRDFEFVYGPILFYWPAYIEKLLAPVGISSVAGYMVSQALMQVIGLGLLFYFIQELPLTRKVKGIAFAVLTFGTLTPLLTLNYTMARFTIAYAALLWIPKQVKWTTQAISVACAEWLMLGISPEIGVAFAGGVIAYALFRGLSSERKWLALIPAPILSFLLFAVCVDRNYFHTIGNFSKGLYNEIIQPLPYVLLFLVTVVAVCPFAMAGYIRRFGRNAAPMVGVYVASLSFVNSALGRCDGIHIFFSSIGLGLISLTGLAGYRGPWPRAWIAAILMIPIWSQVSSVIGSTTLIKRVLFHGPDTEGFDLSRLKTITAGEAIYIPIAAPQFVSQALLANGQLQPSYYSYTVDAETMPDMQRKFAEMQQANYVLMPTIDLTYLDSFTDDRFRFRVFRLGYHYKEIHPLFDTGDIMRQYVNAHYIPLQSFGDKGQYILYRRK